MKNYTYITLLTNDSYIRGVLLLKETLRKVESIYPLKCVVTEDVSDHTLDILKEAGIETIYFDKIATPQNIMDHNMALNKKQALIWKNVLTKFQIFNLDQFDKIIFLDADLYILKNVDHCFEMPHMTAAVDGEYNNIWPLNPHFNTGFVVIKPDKAIFEDIIKFVNNLDPSTVKDYRGEPYILADQEILNLYYNNWPYEEEKHLNKYYNIFPIHTPDNRIPDILENGYFVHFVGSKPWESLNEGISVCTPTLKSGTGCDIFYELAFSVIMLSYANRFKDLNWPELLETGLFEYNVALQARSFFRDFKLAKSYITKALEKDPSDKNYKELNAQIDSCLLAEKVRPTVVDVLRMSFEEAADSNIPTVNYYMLLRVLDNLYSDDAVMLTLRYWNIIRNSTFKYMVDIYNQGNWKELLYQ